MQAVTTDPAAIPPQRLGELLRQARLRTNLSRRHAARSAALSVRRLAALEKGQISADRPTIDALLGVYGIGIDQLIPPRRPITVDGPSSTGQPGPMSVQIGADATPDEVLRAYISLIVDARTSGRLDGFSLRSSDVQILSRVLGTDDDVLVDRVTKLLGCSHEEATWLSLRLRSFVGPIAGVAIGIAVVAGSAMASNTSGASLQPASGNASQTHIVAHAQRQVPGATTSDFNA